MGPGYFVRQLRVAVMLSFAVAVFTSKEGIKTTPLSPSTFKATALLPIMDAPMRSMNLENASSGDPSKCCPWMTWLQRGARSLNVIIPSLSLSYTLAIERLLRTLHNCRTSTPLMVSSRAFRLGKGPSSVSYAHLLLADQRGDLRVVLQRIFRMQLDDRAGRSVHASSRMAVLFTEQTACTEDLALETLRFVWVSMNMYRVIFVCLGKIMFSHQEETLFFLNPFGVNKNESEKSRSMNIVRGCLQRVPENQNQKGIDNITQFQGTCMNNMNGYLFRPLKALVHLKRRTHDKNGIQEYYFKNKKLTYRYMDQYILAEFAERTKVRVEWVDFNEKLRNRAIRKACLQIGEWLNAGIIDAALWPCLLRKHLPSNAECVISTLHEASLVNPEFADELVLLLPRERVLKTFVALAQWLDTGVWIWMTGTVAAIVGRVFLSAVGVAWEPMCPRRLSRLIAKAVYVLAIGGILARVFTGALSSLHIENVKEKNIHSWEEFWASSLELKLHQKTIASLIYYEYFQSNYMEQYPTKWNETIFTLRRNDGDFALLMQNADIIESPNNIPKIQEHFYTVRNASLLQCSYMVATTPLGEKFKSMLTTLTECGIWYQMYNKLSRESHFRYFWNNTVFEELFLFVQNNTERNTSLLDMKDVTVPFYILAIGFTLSVSLLIVELLLYYKYKNRLC